MPRGIYIRTKSLKGKVGIYDHSNNPSCFQKGHMRNWKGDKAGMVAMHIWVKKCKGKANHCVICGRNDEILYNWANIDHSYKRVLDDYASMCMSCHRKYDSEFNS